MQHFMISYDDAKKLLAVFYNATYQSAVPYVNILHNMASISDCKIDGSNLETFVDIERKLAALPTPTEPEVIEAKGE